MSDEKRKPLEFYPWYVTRYRAHRKVQRMNHVERGLYRELLDECWEEGCIPDDINRLAEIARCSVGVMAEAWVNIRPCFEPIDGMDGMFLVSPRLEQIRTQQDAYRLKQAQRRKGLPTADNRGEPRSTTKRREEKRKEYPIVTQSSEPRTDTSPAPTSAPQLAAVLAKLKADR